MIRTRVLAICVAGFSLLAGTAAYAGPTIDFSTLGSGLHGSTLGPSAATGQITITGYQTNFSTPANLWGRNDGVPEEGLGICSSGETNCAGTGEQNELSNQQNLEWIVLQRPTNMAWLQLWVGSLDNGGTGGHEQGTLYWSNTLGDLTTGHFSFQDNSFAGSPGDGDILSLAAASGFNAFAKYVMFLL